MSVASKFRDEDKVSDFDQVVEQLKIVKNFRKRRIILYSSLIATDSFSIMGSFALAHWAYLGSASVASALPFILFVLLSTGIIAALSDGYGKIALISPSKSSKVFLTALSLSFLLLLTAAFGFKISSDFSRFAISLGISGAATIGVLLRIGVSIVSKKMLGAWATGQVLIDDRSRENTAGDIVEAGEFAEEIVVTAKEIGIRPDIGDPLNMIKICDLFNDIDRIYVKCERKDRRAWAEVLKSINVHASVVLEDGEHTYAIAFDKHDGVWSAEVNHGPLSMSQRAMKRLFDLVLTIGAMPIWLTIIIIVGLAVKLESRGPVFFRQKRIGRDNSFFSIFKFRSMYVDLQDGDASKLTEKNDPRVTRVGRFIRRTSLDELPQLFNVLIGDMTLVGPRPHAKGALAGSKLYWEVDNRYWHRHTVKPGITGLAQVKGFRGNTFREIDLQNRLFSDLAYVANWSIKLDLFILVRTFLNLNNKNAF